ncbi:MAG: PHP domain-containing protein [Erysipelotrichaceae bacterium]|nr:PHP domain-containing protein [Erysipelotrichaceae bacterium]
MFYDLHIHSALSPCADDDMTINNIVNMAYIKELDMIAISDHNSVKQLYHLDQVAKDKVQYIYAVEIQTREEVHVLGYFLHDVSLDAIQAFLDEYLIEEPNDDVYFGHQYILNEKDEIIGNEDRLLLKSLDLLLPDVIQHIHNLGGVAVLAHVMARRFSVMNIYYYIDEKWDFDGFEITDNAQYDILVNQFPFLKDKVCLFNSDAHNLFDISEPIHEIDEDVFYSMWRKRYG